MVGLSDIPCVGIALNKISEATVEAAYRGLRYMFCYKGLVNDLDSEIENIKIQEGRVEAKVKEEKNNGKILEVHVTNWREEVEGIKKDSKLFSDTYKSRASWRPNIQCVPKIPNPFSRFRIGREAVKKAERLAALTESGKELLSNPIAHLPPPDNLPKTDGVFQNFTSRKDAYDKLWESLVSEGSTQIHGIYGMPGVGKTRIAEQIWEDAKRKGKFDKFTMAVVSSGELNVIKLQQDLAGHLNCTFASQDNAESRASQLKQSIKNAGKVLIILDDVWGEIRLDVVGIQFGDDSSSKGCKILFTSREAKVLRSNNCIDPVKITALTDGEAWDMFKGSVGTGDIPDESLARKVCAKCAGLPLVIRAVGKALKFVSRDSWIDALERLENCEIESVPGIEPKVYACLKLSFDKLEKDAKLCLLLCSLYPEDAEISIRMLIHLATGSQLVEGGRKRVRIKVHAMVAILKSSLLVLKNEDDEGFKLHDIIRDVARSIAVKDHAFSFIRCDSELPDSSGTPKLLCLQMDKSDFYIPDNLMYQDIHTFWVESAWFASQSQVLEVVSKFVNLRVLVIRNVRGGQQKQNIPLQHLPNLRMIVLEMYDIGAIDFNLFPENIETLCIWDGFLPEPLNIVNLKHLRKLEIRHRNEVVLVANTISSLSSCLEELHIPYGFKYHKAEEHNDDEVNQEEEVYKIDNHSQLMEISTLSRLTSLQLRFQFGPTEHIQDLEKVFSKLSEFDICVGQQRTFQRDSSLTRSIELYGEELQDAFQSLIERAEEVALRCTDVDVSSIFDNNRQAFADLKHLEIDGSGTMEHLAKVSHHHHHLYQIQPWTSFFKLSHLYVGNCSAMKYLFCNSVAKCLMQLEELFVNDCPVMEAIVMNEGSGNSDGQEEEDINIINFPKLKSLRLESMPKLKSFNIEKKKDIMQHTASTISLSDDSVINPAFTLFPPEIAFPALEELWLISLSISDIWGKHYYYNDNASSFSKLKILEVSSCTKLETVIPLAMSHKLQNLEYLDIKDCSLVISEVGTYDDSNTAGVCPLVALTKMHLQKLPCLRNTWLNSILDHSQAITNLYPNLKELEIQKCHSLSNVFLTRDLMMNLEELKVEYCEMMTEIIGAAAEEHKISTGGIIFPKLRTLRLYGLENLTSFRRNQSGEANYICKVVFPNLVECSIQFCHEEIKLEDIEFGRDGSTCCQLKSLEICCPDKEIQLPSTWQLRLDNLEELELSNCWWQKFPCFTRLKQLKVIESRRSTLFLVSVMSSLQQLQVLEISDCALLEDIVTRGNAEASSRDKKIIRLFQLKRVTLKGLPNLRSFMSGADYECHMPALEYVQIDNCGFSVLFPFSVISSSLQQIQKIEISNCALLEGIVEEDVRRGNIEASSSRDKNKKKIIKLYQLKAFILEDLPNLRSFMSGADYECHMPALEYVKIDNCGFSALFPFSVISNLQRLEFIEISDCALLEGIVEEDVRRGNIEASSSRDKKKKKKKIIKALFQLKCVTLTNLPKLRSFMSGANYECHMPSLQDVIIDNCGLSALFTCSTNLQQLRELKVSNCGLLEYIVRDDDDDISKTDDKIIITLSHLLEIGLENLPNLKSFCHNSSYAFDMPL